MTQPSLRGAHAEGGWPVFAVLVMLAIGATACGADTDQTVAPPANQTTPAPAPPPPGSPGPSSGDAEDAPVTRTATWDKVRDDLHVVMAFDAARSVFAGTLANATRHKVCGAQIEIVLQDGTRLELTPPRDLAVDASTRIEIAATGANVQQWSVRTRIAPCGAGG